MPSTRTILTASFVFFVFALLVICIPLAPRFSGVYLPLLFGEPLLMAAGFGSVAALLRSRLSAGSVASSRRVAAAAVVAVASLLLLSVFTQGAGLPLILFASAAAGALGALAVFAAELRRPSQPAGRMPSGVAAG